MPETATDTVTLDRQAVLDLLFEANKVADVLEALTGTCPTRLTDGLTEKAAVVGEAILGPTHDGPGGEYAGVGALWAGDGARKFFLELAVSKRSLDEEALAAAPPVIQALAANFEEVGHHG